MCNHLPCYICDPCYIHNNAITITAKGMSTNCCVIWTTLHQSLGSEVLLAKQRLATHMPFFMIFDVCIIWRLYSLCPRKMCYVWDSIIYIIARMKCLLGFFHRACRPALVFFLQPFNHPRMMSWMNVLWGNKIIKMNFIETE